MSGAMSEITVTTLDRPMAADAGEGQAADAAPAEVAALAVEPRNAAPAPAVEKGDLDPAPLVIADKPPLQIACEKGGGRWATAGTAGSMACVSPTRDGGRQCTRETDCEGLCLARSGSCAPVKPMFGCNDILQADGRRVMLCID